MALVTWDGSYSVGIRAMDEQHKRLVQTLNDLHAAMVSGKASGAADHLLGELVRYTQDHFRAEEAFLARNCYPELATHRGLHAELNLQVNNYVKRLQAGEAAISVHLLHFLRDWLTVHIQREDREYGAWLNARGIS